MIGSTPYRRSNLREALLQRALVVLRERGSAALSLREIARDVGVSHAAPMRHFADRRQLFEALAVEGFQQLGKNLDDAASVDEGFREQARGAAHAYMDFVRGEANLTEIMFRHEPDIDRAAIARSAADAFEPLLRLFARAPLPASGATEQDVTMAATLFLATLQGITALINCGAVPPDAAPDLIEEAVSRIARRPGAV